MKYFLIYLFIINAVCFILMHEDKKRAKKKKRRIRETTFFILATAGGSIGTLVGMYIFRHKTRHASFTVGIPAILAGQILVSAAIYGYL